MFVEDFSFSKDDQGTEYVKPNKDPARSSNLKQTKNQPKMLVTGDPRCPDVQFFKTYIDQRPEEMQNKGSFYLAIIENPKSEVWFKKQRKGARQIEIDLEAELDDEGRKLTNHSVRKTLVKELKASNQPRSAIIPCSRPHRRAFTGRQQGK